MSNSKKRSHSRRVRFPDPRQDAYQRIWRVMQPAITLVSGLPPMNQVPQFYWTRPRIYSCVALWLAMGLTLSLLGTSYCEDLIVVGVPLILIGWVVTIGSFRAMMTTVLHDIVHVLEKHCKQDKSAVFHYVSGWIGEFTTVILVIPSIAQYYADHVLNHHNGRKFCTLADPDAKLLHELGFRPGTAKKALWKKFWRLILEPWSTLYRKFTWERLTAQVESPYRMAYTVVIWVAILGGVGYFGFLPQFLLAVVVPLTFGIPAAALCQFTSEHNWLVARKDSSLRQFLFQTCRGRVFMDALPPPQKVSARWLMLWTRYWLRFLMHAALRVMVCPFDLGAAHDLHHIGEEVIKKDRSLPSWASWLNAGYYRRWVEANLPVEFPLTTHYTLSEALDTVFESYSILDPNDPTILEALANHDRPSSIVGM